MKFFSPHTFAFTAVLAFGLASPANANIYWFTDETGVVHFSNVPTDKRYVPFTMTGEADNKKTAVATGDRRSSTRLKVQYSAIIEEIAQTYALESALIHAVVVAESAYNAMAVSKKGAAGLMQLMPQTAAGLGVDPLDSDQALKGGATYLGQQLTAFGGRADLALAAYNAGPTAVRKAGGIPPYPETEAYAEKVLSRYRQLGGTA